MSFQKLQTLLELPSISFCLSFLLLAMSQLIILPGIEHIPNWAWIIAVILAHIMHNNWIYPGISTGYLAGTLFPKLESGLIQSPEQYWGKVLCTIGCILLSVWVVRKMPKLKSQVFWLFIIFILITLGWIMIRLPDVRIAFVYFSAALIVSILMLVKNRSLNNIPSQLFFGWLAGYIVWVLSIFLFSLDPENFTNVFLYLKKYILIPYSVFLLGILIAAHMISLIRYDNNNLNN
ncbi:hypothetical protein K8T06_02660 [bacterium]|nr:hypothetical protein [bacterium]